MEFHQPRLPTKKYCLKIKGVASLSIDNHYNATRVTQHNVKYAKMLARRGYSTVYYAQNNSRAFVKLC